ncbi:MAG: type II toxin-antitoxin system RelE/ParE family toxin [Actinomycetia bacterium]|nr:type II toxin-antitoxin system RelE/ParE family toxin [Actinomycetes bacterium]
MKRSLWSGVTAEPYRVALSPTARRNLSQYLPELFALAAVELIHQGIAHQPYRRGRQLSPPLERVWKANRGTYRVLYEIDEHQRIIRILRIAHRRDAYRT